MTVNLLVLTVLPLLLILAAVWDLTSYTIPNILPISTALLFVLFAVLHPIGWAATGIHVLTGFAALVIGIIMFSLGWIGGGDAKLYAACALWLGWPDILTFTLIAALAGGVLSVVLIGFRMMALPGFLMKIKWVMALHEKKAGIPYGIALSAGFLIYLPHTLLIAQQVLKPQ